MFFIGAIGLFRLHLYSIYNFKLETNNQMTNKEQDILNKIEEMIVTGELSNEFLISSLKLSCD